MKQPFVVQAEAESWILGWAAREAAGFFRYLHTNSGIDESVLGYLVGSVPTTTAHQNGLWFTCGNITIDFHPVFGFRICFIDDAEVMMEVDHILQQWKYK